MSEELPGGPAGLESSPPLSQPDVERARRLALTRLDELEASFHRVSERLVSVEARLGELAEDLRVRVTALQQQTREAVTNTLQGYEPSREIRGDVTRAVEELKDALRADVQEVAASMRGAFAESEQRVLDNHVALLERIGVSAQEQAARAEAAQAAVDALRDRLAAAPGGDELRAAIEALQLEVAASAPSEALRQAIEGVREHAASPADLGSLRAVLESLREEVARASAPDEELRQALGSLREEVARSSAPTEELRQAIEGVREQAASTADLGSLRAALESLREEVARASGPREDLREPIDGLRREVEAALERLAAVVGQGMEAAPTALDQRLGDLREHVERSAQTLNVQTIAQVEQVQEAIEGWMMRFRDLLEVSLQSAHQRPEADSGAQMEELRADVGVVSRSLQERLSQLDATLQELRDRVDQVAEVGAAVNAVREVPVPPPPPPSAVAAEPPTELAPEEGAEAPAIHEPAAEVAPAEAPPEAPPDEGTVVEPPPSPEEAAPEGTPEEAQDSQPVAPEEVQASEPTTTMEEPATPVEALPPASAPTEPSPEDAAEPQADEQEREEEADVEEEEPEPARPAVQQAPPAPKAPSPSQTPRRAKRLPDLWSWGPRKQQSPQG